MRMPANYGVIQSEPVYYHPGTAMHLNMPEVHPSNVLRNNAVHHPADDIDNRYCPTEREPSTDHSSSYAAGDVPVPRYSCHCRQLQPATYDGKSPLDLVFLEEFDEVCDYMWDEEERCTWS